MAIVDSEVGAGTGMVRSLLHLDGMGKKKATRWQARVPFVREVQQLRGGPDRRSVMMMVADRLAASSSNGQGRSGGGQ